MAEAHATRLESLFHLIRDGSCAEIRANAAEQLGQLAVQAPSCCRAICQQLRGLLLHDDWDVRVASTKCLDVIAAALWQQWDEEPTGESLAERCARVSVGGRTDADAALLLLNFRTVDIKRVVVEGAPLLRSGGEEYQYETQLSESERRVHAIKQRRLLLRRICGGNDSIWSSREDEFAQQMLPRLNQDRTWSICVAMEYMLSVFNVIGHFSDLKDIADDIKQSEDNVALPVKTESSSKRKRAAELLPSNGTGDSAPRRKLQKTESSDSVSDQPLSIVAMLVIDLFECTFDSKWEVRHGALMSLRQVFLSSKMVESLAHSRSDLDLVDKWLEECLVRCLCVLALDQFVDYSADGSVAPVREVCAQVFGLLLGNLSQEQLLVEYLRTVRQLFHGAAWHAKHGGLLGLKYLVRAHMSHANVLVPMVFGDVMDGLVCGERVEEEVIATAASMAEDFAAYLVNVSPQHMSTVLSRLWVLVAIHKNVGIIPACAISALSSWYNNEDVCARLEDHNITGASLQKQNLSSTIPLLHQYTQTVRTAAARCLAALFSSQRGSLAYLVDSEEVLRALLSHLLLQILRESEKTTREALVQAWQAVVVSLSIVGGGSLLEDVISECVCQWFDLLWALGNLSCLNVSILSNQVTKEYSDTSAVSNSKENLSSRVAFADCLGFLGSRLDANSSSRSRIIYQLKSSILSSAGERQCGALLALSRWAWHGRSSKDSNLSLQTELGDTLQQLANCNWLWTPSNGSTIYAEQAAQLKRARVLLQKIKEVFANSKIPTDMFKLPRSTNSAEVSRAVAEHAATLPYDSLSGQSFEVAHFTRQDLFLLDESLRKGFQQYYQRVQGLGASAFCNVLPIPSKKSGFLVKALMEAIKTEDRIEFQEVTATTLASFVISQASIQRKCVAKIVQNLCNSATALVGVEDVITDQHSESASDAFKMVRVRVAGAENALRAICREGGSEIFDKCPTLLEIISQAWTEASTSEQAIQQALHILMLVLQDIEQHDMSVIVEWVTELAKVVQSNISEVTRAMAAKTIGACCKHAGAMLGSVLLVVYQNIFSVLDTAEPSDPLIRDALLGAAHVLCETVEALREKIAPFVPSLLHLSMKSMCSLLELVRSLAARAFAELVPLISLQTDFEIGQTDSTDARAHELKEIVQRNQVSRQFLQNLMDGEAIQSVDAQKFVKGSVVLRDYQQHGIDWLGFLVQNNLHGILADDMGLGKTLQTLAVIVATHAQQSTPSTAIVVCPPVVADHWVSEASSRFCSGFDEVVNYSGSTSERKSIGLKRKLEAYKAGGAPKSRLIVTTYAVLRSEIDIFADVFLSFAVLDEAHLIRNPKTSLFDAVRRLQASHRIALSGTPLQNNVTDLWSLFEFLMPGYLGEFSSFRREFVGPITKSKERNATAKQKEAASFAIATLHRKVLPFILRRTKTQVLKELPPKIISNVLVPMPTLQARVYKAATAATSDTSRSQASERADGVSSVLNNLQLLRKICVHPTLASAVKATLSAKDQKHLQDWSASGKLVALRDLLVDSCNFAPKMTSKVADKVDDIAQAPSHRCLIFAHFKETLDLVEQMVDSSLSGVDYRRLDGHTPQSARGTIVKQFNEDPTIDLLLLTTSVGGLGLTLTGADTVIFVEHSWNPFVDLQAMDRAHRIGQTRTVRVFRLIMKETLEEHIMNLQAFKQGVASTVIADHDASTSMSANTKQVLALLEDSSLSVKAHELVPTLNAHDDKLDRASLSFLPSGAAALLGKLGELWDETQYDSLSFPAS
ncbi:TPA: hypothetical protein N0F65_005211 [Lagenidium giganteum]|uniref:Uncharacterized protein n=1 Tax=Lagenidium giganteum TaxID=4803 RepID=A0AAV2YYZ1_9STRA|nr:TPA: hypothetical protein N0F65_005211 [Lagenidium giganteum]